MDLREDIDICRVGTPIGARIGDGFEQLVLAGGYDHNWVLNPTHGGLRSPNSLAAHAWSPRTGIRMTVSSNMPGVQFYTGNFLDGCPRGKGGAPYGKRWGFCLETQFYPDTPNRPEFPSCVLRPEQGELCRRTSYRFFHADSIDPPAPSK